MGKDPDQTSYFVGTSASDEFVECEGLGAVRRYVMDLLHEGEIAERILIFRAGPRLAFDVTTTHEINDIRVIPDE